jgi:CHAD domain-containing protein
MNRMTGESGTSGKSDRPGAKEPPILDYMDGQVEKLRTLVPRALRECAGDVEAVHDARVATRRLKAAFDLLKPVLPERHLRKFARTLRKLRRRLGPIRDLDVISGHLAELQLTDGSAVHTQPIVWLAQRIQREREQLAQSARDDAPPRRVLTRLGAWWGLREEIAGASETVGPLLGESLRSQFDCFAVEANRLLSSNGNGDLGEAMERPVDPHAIRIAGKSLRYTLEMARAQGSELDPEVFKTFKKMQDALGLWHDFVVLTERILSMSSAEQLAHHDAPAQRRILALAQATLERAETHLEAFAKLWEQQGPTLAEVVRQTAPLSRDVSAPRTDHGPAGSIRSQAAEDADRAARRAS